jgi:hypothetical protein
MSHHFSAIASDHNDTILLPTTLRAFAVLADENGCSQQAAASYEAALVSDPADLESTVNLAVLYWRASGRRPTAPGELPGEVLQRAEQRLGELVERASERFAGRAEWRFWKRYIAATEAGQLLEPEECRQLLRERPDYLEPAFVLFSDTAGEEAEPEAMRLLVAYSEQPTARGRYVTARINAVIQKYRRHRGPVTRLCTI